MSTSQKKLPFGLSPATLVVAALAIVVVLGLTVLIYKPVEEMQETSKKVNQISIRRDADISSMPDYFEAHDRQDVQVNERQKVSMATYRRGKILYNGEHYEAAITAFTQSIKEFPKVQKGIDEKKMNESLSSRYQLRGYCYAKLKQMDNAIKDWTIAIDLHPMTAINYKNRALAYKAVGKTALAEADFKKANDLHEDVTQTKSHMLPIDFDLD